jgi:hypothetical protein
VNFPFFGSFPETIWMLDVLTLLAVRGVPVEEITMRRDEAEVQALHGAWCRMHLSRARY